MHTSKVITPCSVYFDTLIAQLAQEETRTNELHEMMHSPLCQEDNDFVTLVSMLTIPTHCFVSRVLPSAFFVLED